MSEEINFESLNINIPQLVKTHSIEQQREIFQYLSQLDDHNKKAYEIAFNHLGSSFNIYRSNGFKEWKQKKN
jgi:hypothetical protein